MYQPETTETEKRMLAKMEFLKRTVKFRHEFDIEEVIKGEEHLDSFGYYYGQVYQLFNGLQVEKEQYFATVQNEIRRYLVRTYHEGFLDSQGIRWRVDNIDLVTFQLSDFDITQRFEGTTPLHRLIEKIKSHPDVPFYLPHELELYPHDEEEHLLSQLRPTVRIHYLEMKDKVITAQS